MANLFNQRLGGGYGRSRRAVKKNDLSYTSLLIGVNVVVFFIVWILGVKIGYRDAFSWVALMPETILVGEKIWTFLTSMFMHGNFTHLLVNMVSLMFIGNFVEKLIGKKRFIWLYFIGGLFAGLLFVMVALALKPDAMCQSFPIDQLPSYCMFAVGASGAIFALGGLLAVLTPRLPVLVFFVIPMPMWAAMGFLMFGLWALSLGLDLPIGNIAHFGGLIIGVGYGFYLKRRFPRKTAMISKYFSR